MKGCFFTLSVIIGIILLMCLVDVGATLGLVFVLVQTLGVILFWALILCIAFSAIAAVPLLIWYGPQFIKIFIDNRRAKRNKDGNK